MSKKLCKPLVLILSLLLVLSTVTLSIFGLKKESARADTVTSSYVYKGSSLFVPSWDFDPFTYFQAEKPTDGKGFLDFAIDIQRNAYDTGVFNIRFNVTYFRETNDAPAQYSRFTAWQRQGVWQKQIPDDSFLSQNRFSQVFNGKYVPIIQNYTSLGDRFWLGDVIENFTSSSSPRRGLNEMYIGCSSHSFNGGIVSVEIGSFPVSDIGDNLKLYSQGNFGEPFDYINFIRYTDINGNWLQFGFPSISATAKNNYWNFVPLVFTNRTYYTDLFFTSNGLYEEGLSDGYQNGWNAYKDSSEYALALARARNEGYNKGSADGFARGSAVAEGDYNFTTAVSTLIGAPIDVTARMLNFNLLGVNVWALVGGLFTLLLIIKIIRIFL